MEEKLEVVSAMKSCKIEEGSNPCKSTFVSAKNLAIFLKFFSIAFSDEFEIFLCFVEDAFLIILVSCKILLQR